jgi:2-isopropylmalate synthase
LNCVSNAICQAYGIQIRNLVYTEHDLDRGANSRGIAYFGLTDENGKTAWGAGVDTDTITASIYAFVSAVNRMEGINERVKFRTISVNPDAIFEFKSTAEQH